MDEKRHRILVAVDGSNQSLDAVGYIGRMLRPETSEIVLFNVMRDITDAFRDVGADPTFHSRIADISQWQLTQENMLKKFMDEGLKVLTDNGFHQDSVEIKIFKSQVGVARDIIEESKKGYSAVVVGRRGLSRLMDIMMGSVAYKLVERLANVPVWVVGGAPTSSKVLVAVDHSQGAMRAVDHVGDILGGRGKEITLLNVLRTPSMFVPELETLSPDKQKEIFSLAKDDVEPVFNTAKGVLTESGFAEDQITTNLITGVMSRAGTIVDEARRGGYGTIVIGRRGISRVEEFFMGRVSNKVISLAKEMAVWVVN
ncbi:UspA domain protein [uncultured Desulfobacterium sp.]|uniref:UspA domain protein n=1 Tax=uncultured Desulfobacterium sp. TaxID=201089 RepID=A0A445MX45_9BACT|nr:UspA domain protein [uncultured Desulfobacterium sp.]